MGRSFFTDELILYYLQLSPSWNSTAHETHCLTWHSGQVTPSDDRSARSKTY